MGPKSKKSKFDWVECPLCGILFSSKSSSLHSLKCSVGNQFSVEALGVKPEHGFIYKESLVGDIIIFDGSIDNFPKSRIDKVVFLNPITMRVLKICIGDPVVINHKKMLTAWPDSNLGLTNIGLNELARNQLNLHDTAVLYNFDNCHLIAQEILLVARAQADFLCSPQFQNFTLNYLDKQFWTTGNDVGLSYGGKPCFLSVQRITGEDGTIFKDLENTHQDSMLQEFTNLNLNDTNEKIIKQEPLSLKRYHKKFFKVTRKTKLVIKPPNFKDTKTSIEPTVILEDFGGYTVQIQRARDMLDIALQLADQKELCQTSVSFPRGVLFYGPSGCGKTMLSKALVNAYDAYVVTVSGSDIWSKFHGESEMNLKRMFREAKDRAPSILVIDDLDTLCPKRDSSNSDVEKRLVSAMLTLIDDLVSCGKATFLLAMTSKRDQIDPALRRPGRLDREIELPVPNAQDRYHILKKLMARDGSKSAVSDETLKHIADNAHGFVGADLAALYKEACMSAIRRHKPPGASTQSAQVELVDLEHALSVVQPSAMREVAIEVPQVRWEDIGGQHDLKHKLKQAIEWPLKHPEAFLRLGITPPKGLLMYGPPGCSKTMIAKALARESGINFIAIKGPELFSKWVGESERAVREVFRKARAAAPAIVFFDEIDALAGERGGHGGGGGGDVSDRVLAQLLTEIDGVEALHDVTVVAATNRPDRIDKALLRPGRLDRIVFVPLPDTSTRSEIFQIQFRKMPIAEDVSLDELVEKTDRYSGAEVTAVCREAALSAMQEDITIAQIHHRHFEQALITVTPRITDQLLEFYTNYAQTSSLHSI